MIWFVFLCLEHRSFNMAWILLRSSEVMEANHPLLNRLSLDWFPQPLQIIQKLIEYLQDPTEKSPRSADCKKTTFPFAVCQWERLLLKKDGKQKTGMKFDNKCCASEQPCILTLSAFLIIFTKLLFIIHIFFNEYLNMQYVKRKNLWFKWNKTNVVHAFFFINT